MMPPVFRNKVWVVEIITGELTTLLGSGARIASS
jgi:hypothetical protein